MIYFVSREPSLQADLPMHLYVSIMQWEEGKNEKYTMSCLYLKIISFVSYKRIGVCTHRQKVEKYA